MLALILFQPDQGVCQHFWHERPFRFVELVGIECAPGHSASLVWFIFVWPTSTYRTFRVLPNLTPSKSTWRCTWTGLVEYDTNCAMGRGSCPCFFSAMSWSQVQIARCSLAFHPISCFPDDHSETIQPMNLKPGKRQSLCDERRATDCATDM